MRSRARASFVALTGELERRFPDLTNPVAAVVAGHVLVDDRVVTNPRARVRRDAGIRLDPPRPLRGRQKLATALDAFEVDVDGRVAVDLGAAAGGFTDALLRAGATRVYAVDVGFGQLRGHLRQDPRVVNLERTNVSDLDRTVVADVLAVATMDLSYLPVAEAVGSLDQLRWSPGAVLVALVKPTFELRASTLVVSGEAVRRAVVAAVEAIGGAGWTVLGCTLPAVTGAGGAVEVFVAATRP